MSQYDPSDFIKENYNEYLNNLIDNRKHVHKFSDKVPDKTIINKILNYLFIFTIIRNTNIN